MTNRELKDFLILRQIEPPVTHAEREQASERSIAALDTVRKNGKGIDWVKSEIFTDAQDQVKGTLCHFKAESEDAIRDHADCAGLPVTQIYRRGHPVDGPSGSADR